MLTNTQASEKKLKRPVINKQLLSTLPRLVILILIGVGLSILSPYFLVTSNLLNILYMASVPIILAIAQTIVVLTGNIDLSLGAIFSIGGVVTAALMHFLEVPMGLSVIAGLLTGGLMGFLNGLLVAKLKLPSFIGTYGLRVATTGIAVAIMQGYVVYGFPESFRFFGVGRVNNIPVPIFITIFAFFVAWFLLKRTTFGRKIYALGANSEAARLSGIKVDKMLILVFMIAGVFAALAGIVQISRVNSSHAFLGDSLLLPAIAAVVIGGTSMFGGVGGVFGTVIGALIMSLISNGLTLLGAPSIIQQFINGLIILIAIVIDQSFSRVTSDKTR